MAYDNVSKIPARISDLMCRLAVGGGFTTRKLYSGRELERFEAERPQIVNGIGAILTRSDLRDRALELRLEPIPDAERKTEADLEAQFADAAPKILGALLDAVAAGIRNLDAVRLATKPRMADFAHWIVACEAALWDKPRFLDAYKYNRESADGDAVESNPVAVAILALGAEKDAWEGTASALLEVLKSHNSWNTDWPHRAISPREMSNALERAAPALRARGMAISRDRIGHNRSRIIRLSWPESLRVEASPTEAIQPQAKHNGGDRGSGAVTAATKARATAPVHRSHD